MVKASEGFGYFRGSSRYIKSLVGLLICPQTQFLSPGLVARAYPMCS